MKNIADINFKKIAAIVFWTVIVLFAVVRISSQQIKINRYNAEVAMLDESIENLEAREIELETQADIYSSDEYIEEIARTRLGYVRSDEVVFKKAD